MKEFDDLVEIMHRLRQECPWDREQNLKSLRPYLLEEAYECVAALDSGDQNHHIEELGDVLLQVLFHSELLTEELKRPVIRDVLVVLAEKLIRRHPHVFGDASDKTKDSEQVLKRWAEIKEQEKKDSGKSLSSTFVDEVGRGLTSLQTAYKLGKASQKVKFDWQSSTEVWPQVISELQELQEAKNASEREEEFGDLLFALAQWARHEKIDPEVALAAANEKFKRRARAMVKMAEKSQKDFEGLSSQEKEDLWQAVKKNET